jgi:hypothetical protein
MIHGPHQSSSTSVIAVNAARKQHTNVGKNQQEMLRSTLGTTFRSFVVPWSRSCRHRIPCWIGIRRMRRGAGTQSLFSISPYRNFTLRRRRLRLSTCNASSVVKVVQCGHLSPDFACKGMQLFVASYDPSLLTLTGAMQSLALRMHSRHEQSIQSSTVDGCTSARSQPHCQLRVVGKQKDASGLLLPVLNIAC